MFSLRPLIFTFFCIFHGVWGFLNILISGIFLPTGIVMVFESFLAKHIIRGI